MIKTDRRRFLPYLWGGVIAAVIVSLGVGAALMLTATQLPENVEAIVAGTVSIGAAGLVTWMLFWLARTARGLAGHLREEVDRSLARGAGISLIALAFLSVGREGVETALFIWSAAGAAGTTLFPLLGAVLGLAVSVSLGYLIYRGMTILNLRSFFAWSGGLLVLMVAGVLSHGVGDLQSGAGWLPGGSAVAFDMTSVVPEDSWLAVVSQTLLGISPAMTWLQVFVWVVYVAVALPLFLSATLRKHEPASTPSVATERKSTPTEPVEVVGAR